MAAPTEHHLLIVDAVNAALGPVVHAAGEAIGYEFQDAHAPIPNYMVMIGLITIVIVAAVIIGVEEARTPIARR